MTTLNLATTPCTLPACTCRATPPSVDALTGEPHHHRPGYLCAWCGSPDQVAASIPTLGDALC